MADDTTAIRNLLYRYAELIDDGDLDGVGALFEHAVVDWGGDRTDGGASMAERLAATTRLYDDGTPRTAHVITNAVIEVHDGTARARSRFTVFQATEGLDLQPIICGRYHDTFECDVSGWRFSGREYHIDLVGDLSHHLPGSLVAMLTAGAHATSSRAPGDQT